MKMLNGRVPAISERRTTDGGDVRPYNRGLQCDKRNRDCTDLDIAIHIVLDD